MSSDYQSLNSCFSSYLLKANISREEYDRQRQLVQLDHDHEEELDDQLSSYTDEYRQFQPEEQREILILNHRKFHQFKIN